MNRIAVVLLNLGGPDSLEAVEPFLINLFSDPDIFKLPFQKAFARFIAKRRSPGVRANYESIGGKSPIGYWTEKQRAMLETELRTTHPETDVFVAMR
ncbi:MAG: ferrochelatase, partial [Candidatus Hydrogenedentes bacterium]|nr:ferrochelatase [Candidatus Hydrogenedentota bacterium]